MSADAYSYLLNQSKNYSPNLHRLVSNIGPISFPRRKSTNLLKFLCRTVIGQQLSVNAARKIWERVISTNDNLSLDDTEIFYSNNYECELKNCGISRNKVKAIYSISSFLKENPGIEKEMKKYTHKERQDLLTQIWGVGEWTVDMTSLFFYKDADIWPLSDISIIRGYSNLTMTSKNADSDGIDNAIRYTPYRSYLALYLWKGLDSGAV